MGSVKQGNGIIVIKHKSILIVALFALSLVNGATLIISSTFVTLWLCFKYKDKGAIEAFLFLQFRSLLSSGVGVQYSGAAALVKWILVFFLSFYLLHRPTKNECKNIINRIILNFSVFSTLITLFAWINSSYPLVATFKIVSYVIPFLAIVKGICNTYYVDWRKEFIFPLGIILFGGLVFVKSEIGYLRNGYSFQGAINHPNIFGIMLAVFLGCLLYKKTKLKIIDLFLIVGIFYMMYLSGSRTSLMTGVIIVVLFVLSKEINKTLRIILIALMVLIIVLIVLSESGTLTNSIIDIVYKGHEGNLFYSRSRQIAKNINRFLEHPLIGTGLNVPYDSSIKSMEFSFGLVTENGNLILAILGDLGIVGSILFVIVYRVLFCYGSNGLDIAFFIPFLVCMGEMSFFSTNNFGIILYAILALYLSEGIKRRIWGKHI